MIRLAVLVAGALVAVIVLTFLVDVARARVLPKLGKLPKPTRRQRDYDWERRTDQLVRRAKAVPAPQEDRERILGFLESRAGVEAFVEPRTVVHPLSVVLVADDGEWIRVALRDDAYLRELARSHGLSIHDAMRTGYPERMRRYRRPASEPGSEGEPQA